MFVMRMPSGQFLSICVGWMLGVEVLLCVGSGGGWD